MSETVVDRPSPFHRDERDGEKPDQSGVGARELDVAAADLNGVDEHAAIDLDQDLAGDRGYGGLVSSRRQPHPWDWDGGTLRAVERCHHVAAAHAVGSLTPGGVTGPNAGPPSPKPGLTICEDMT